MRRKFYILIVMILSVLALASCVEVQNIEWIEFDQYPKTTYLQNEEIELFTVLVKERGKDPIVLSSDDSRVSITGFDTETTGTKTMRIFVDGITNVSLNFVYTVVSSLVDTFFDGGSGTALDPYGIANAQHLSNIRLNLGAHYKLTDNFDVDIETFIPIGELNTDYDPNSGNWTLNIYRGFYGNLNGDNHTIRLFNNGDSISDPDGFEGLFAVLGRGNETVTVRNLVLDYDINTPNQPFVGLANNGASGDGSIAVRSALKIHNVTTTGTLNIKSGTPMINTLHDGVFEVDGYVNEADMYVSEGLNSFLLVKGSAGTHIFTNSVNRGDLVQRSDAEGDSFYAGVFVAAQQNYRKSHYLFDNVVNEGNMIGRTDISSYHFIGHTYDNLGDVNLLEQVNRFSKGIEDLTIYGDTVFSSDHIHEFIGVYAYNPDNMTDYTYNSLAPLSAVTIVINDSETLEDGAVTWTVLATNYINNETGRDFDIHGEVHPTTDFTYETFDNEGVTNVRITGQRNESAKSALVIPVNIEGNPVTEIAADAFNDNRRLTSIEIPETVTTMGNNTFKGAWYLSVVEFAQGSQLDTIPADAFNNAQSLTSITIPSSVTNIGDRAFKNTPILTDLVLPDGLLSIGAEFINNTNIAYLVIPATVNTILNNAFLNAGQEDFAIFVNILENDVPAWNAPTGWGLNWHAGKPVYYQGEWSDVSGIPTPN